MYPCDVAISAPICSSAFKCRSTGRAPIAQPPGNETRATPTRAISGPSVRIDAQKLSLGQCHLVPEALQVLKGCMRNLIFDALLGHHCVSIHIQFDGREYLEEGLHHRSINCTGGDVLTDGHVILLAQGIAEIMCPAFVLDPHFVSTLGAVDDAMQQCRSSSRHPTGLVAVVFSIVVGKPGLDLLERFPKHIAALELSSALLIRIRAHLALTACLKLPEKDEKTTAASGVTSSPGGRAP